MANSALDTPHPIDDFIDDEFYTKKGKLNGKILLHVFLLFVWCVDGVQRVYVLMVTIRHIETFVTFDFDPSIISRLITDSHLNQTE